LVHLAGLKVNDMLKPADIIERGAECRSDVSMTWKKTQVFSNEKKADRMCCILDIYCIMSHKDIAKHKRYTVIHMHT
jgi:hypothetical protein